MLAEGQQIDLVCFGRINVDLYGEQTGATLSSVQSFAKYVGGSAANICVGSARLGLRLAMLTRVGSDEFGKFLVTSLQREGIDVSHVQFDSERPTAVVALAERQRDDFPRIFFYRDSPDSGRGPGPDRHRPGRPSACGPFDREHAVEPSLVDDIRTPRPLWSAAQEEE